MANVPISAFTVPANTVGIGATGYSLTGSASASFMDLAGTWNTTGTPTLIKANVTDTASNAASLLMDLQVGGTSRFRVQKNGVVFSTFATVSTGAGEINLNFYQPGVGVSSAGQFTFSTSSITANVADTILTRRGAANLRFGAADAAAPVAQTLSVQSVVAGTTNTAGAALTITGSQGTGTGAGGSIIFQVAPAGSSGTAQNALATFAELTSARAFNLYNTFTDASNYERAIFSTASPVANFLNIGTQALGTGAPRSIRIFTESSAANITFVTNNTDRWNISGSGHFLANTDNLYDIGASGATRPRQVYVGTKVTTFQLEATGTVGLGKALTSTSYVSFAASTTGLSSLNIAQGAAPTAPVDGDIWREDNTNTGLKIRVNGVTKTITLS